MATKTRNPFLPNCNVFRVNVGLSVPALIMDFVK